LREKGWGNLDRERERDGELVSKGGRERVSKLEREKEKGRETDREKLRR
jgi:hypothetical protein